MTFEDKIKELKRLKKQATTHSEKERLNIQICRLKRSGGK